MKVVKITECFQTWWLSSSKVGGLGKQHSNKNIINVKTAAPLSIASLKPILVSINSIT